MGQKILYIFLSTLIILLGVGIIYLLGLGIFLAYLAGHYKEFGIKWFTLVNINYGVILFLFLFVLPWSLSR